MSEFKLGDLVWAEIEDYPPWPGIIVIPPDDIERKPRVQNVMHCVFFFGPEICDWIEVTKLNHYHECKERFIKNAKFEKLRHACDEIEKYIMKRDKFILSNPSDPQVIESTSSSLVSTGTKLRMKSGNPSTQRDDHRIGSPPRTSSQQDVSTSEELNLNVSCTLYCKEVISSKYNFGFLELGIMGSAIVKHLLRTGHTIIVWTTSPEMRRELETIGVQVALTPSDIVIYADILVCCITNSTDAKKLLIGSSGILSKMDSSKSLVQMTCMDVEDAQRIADSVVGSIGGRYLEAHFYGGEREAEEGTLIFITGGNKSLFEECTSFFDACGQRSLFTEDIGIAIKLYAALQLITAIALGGLQEGLALANEVGLAQNDVIEVLRESAMNCALFHDQTKGIGHCCDVTSTALSHLQDGTKLALNLADSIDQSVPLAATMYEMYIKTKGRACCSHDAAALNRHPPI